MRSWRTGVRPVGGPQTGGYLRSTAGDSRSAHWRSRWPLVIASQAQIKETVAAALTELCCSWRVHQWIWRVAWLGVNRPLITVGDLLGGTVVRVSDQWLAWGQVSAEVIKVRGGEVKTGIVKIVGVHPLLGGARIGCVECCVSSVGEVRNETHL